MSPPGGFKWKGSSIKGLKRVINRDLRCECIGVSKLGGPGSSCLCLIGFRWKVHRAVHVGVLASLQVSELELKGGSSGGFKCEVLL